MSPPTLDPALPISASEPAGVRDALSENGEVPVLSGSAAQSKKSSKKKKPQPRSKACQSAAATASTAGKTEQEARQEKGMRPPKPAAPSHTLGPIAAAQHLSQKLAVPTVSCSNCPAIPTARREAEYPVISGKCTCCYICQLLGLGMLPWGTCASLIRSDMRGMSPVCTTLGTTTTFFEHVGCYKPPRRRTAERQRGGPEGMTLQ